MRIKDTIVSLTMFLVAMAAQAQITIGGNVYGGGNEGKVGGNTAVTLYSGDIDKVFGGSRMADIDGRSFVHLDGEHASDYMLINYVYGGNDISGTIGKKTGTDDHVATIPTEIEKETENSINNTWDAYVRISTKTETVSGKVQEVSDAKKIYIGQLFAGGNGDYDYDQSSGTPTIYEKGHKGEEAYKVATATGDFHYPNLKKTYMEILGGSIVYAFGGGNNATVTEQTVIHVENPSKVVSSIVVGGTELLNQDRIKKMGYNPGYTYPTSDAFQIGSFFGGNNKAPMAIRPKWNLMSGKIRNLYSGGNEGAMTSTEGLLVEIPAASTLKVDNLYGGCRKADVIPGGNINAPVPVNNLTDLDANNKPKYYFPNGFSARVLVRGGDVNNIYGGNDISGKVYGGNAVGVYTSIRGNIYGSGNGSYPYTDNASLANDPTYGDLYYNPSEVLQNAGITFSTAKLNSVEALNLFRPNAEQVSIRVAGTENKKTIIHGSIYLGGNSATLSTNKAKPTVELKIGSYVIADNVYLGNNGADMVKYHEGNPSNYEHEGVLRTYKRTLAELTAAKLTTEDYSGNSTKFSQIDLTETAVFEKYMEGCVMPLMPSVVFDNTANNDPDTYKPYTSYFGSFYCGGNVGSMRVPNTTTINFTYPVIVYDKLVGGCNNANVDEVTNFNAAYEGGLLGTSPNGVKLEMNLSGLKIQPKRWNSDNTALVWNTFDANGNEVAPEVYANLPNQGISTSADTGRRLRGGNVYGGCYNSGHVNGDVVINLNASIIDRKGQYAVFDSIQINNEGEALLYGHENYTICKRRSGVILDEQGMDVLGKALNVFGGGYGPESEIWGSTTINLKRGYTFQIFGGGEQGAIGKPIDPEDATTSDYTFTYKKNGVSKTKKYRYDSKYSCTINLCGEYEGVYRDHADDKPLMAEAEFIYGGAFLGPIAGNTRINLGNGRIFNSFAGSCNADILGHTETYVGLNESDDTKKGFPYIRDHIYGGNDLGGKILGEVDFKSRVNATTTLSHVYNPKSKDDPDVLKASAYTEFIQGRVNYIFGGCYGVYDYTDREFKDYTDATGKAINGFTKPRLNNAFINFKPADHTRSSVNRIYGAGQGYSLDSDRDIMQTRSYILIDDSQGSSQFQDMSIFGAGESCGLGMDVTPATAQTNTDGVTAAAVIDLVRGEMAAAYGASFKEGVTRRTIVNVPTGSTIKIGSIFGGGYGTNTYLPCDAYEANVNYSSDQAWLVYDSIKVANRGAIYGGNNNERRTLYGRVNIASKVNQQHSKHGATLGTVYGAGCGGNTWSEYTEVNLENGAHVYEVYGGGQNGKVYNTESVANFIKTWKPTHWPKVNPDDPNEEQKTFSDEDWANAWALGAYYPVTGKDYWNCSLTNLANPLVRVAEMDDRDFSDITDSNILAMVQNKYTANVIIKKGAIVENYAYGAGYGSEALVSGNTYIALLGGEVKKDIYASGTSGSVEDLHGAGIYSNETQEGFVASTNVYIKGGTVRNVFGGGWRGSVGHHGKLGVHSAQISDVTNNNKDLDGESHVVIGDLNGTDYYNGIPSITRNVYGGGEGGAIFGDAYVTINKGYIGYRYKNTAAENNTPNYEYVPELDDVEAGDLDKSGNVFGGGYVANSYVDRSHVTMKGGIVRGSLFGGGEIGPIGRGTVHADSLKQDHIKTSIKNGAAIYKGGETHVAMWDGHVMRDVFGGGRGSDNWGGDGWMTDDEKVTMDRSSKGYVFGSTDVHIYGGEIGTEANVLKGFGNVFGGGDEGFVYSATGKKVGNKQNSDQLTNGKPTDGGGFYYKDGVIADGLTLDCNVVVEPRCKVTATDGITIGSTTYAQGEYVPVEALNQLKNRDANNTYNDIEKWNKLDTRGITIHNALFAGGNITEGSDKLFANTITVYGNAAASLRDVYNIDLISLGTEEMGGLYGDGNLTLVDGFREVHIDNYGTDWYSLPETMELDDYNNNLTARQQAYYKLKYIAKTSHTYNYWESRQLHTDESTNTSYRKGQKVTPSVYGNFTDKEKEFWTQGSKSYLKDDQIEEGEYSLMSGTETDGEKSNWKLYGVTSIYAGRPMNTIQRADMCGVFGSRIVMKGAVDRAPQVKGGVDYNSYTINRVDEVSLNKRVSQAGDTSDKDKEHGNYFGIYNSVKFLGNLTSDVFFTEERLTSDPNDVAIRKTNTDKDELKADGKTYYQWKRAKPQWKYRNNGTSYNKVALASGVFLELKREEGETTGIDDWGYITGVIELDLINVMPGMGGGYVYAKNEHGKKTWHSEYGKVSLVDYNNTARTYRRFEYSESSSDLQPIETSGNFVHNTKQIVDDCYPNGGVYKDGYKKSPAHYWFVRGSVYVYEQYLSAYTGAANATAEKQEIPLTITAASNGRMTLRDVKPNLYAYYDKNGNKLGDQTANADTVFVVNNVAYKLNQPISNWEYNLLSEGDKAKFVEKTYVVIEDCKIGNVEYKKGRVMLESEYNSLKNSNPTITYMEDDEEKTDGNFDYFFRSSNNLGHDTGYVLTYDVNNPMVWNNYYTKTIAPGQANALNTKQYDELPPGQSDYTEGPTYTLKSGVESTVFGQQDYIAGSIIYGSVVTNYKKEIFDNDSNPKVNNLGTNPPKQAQVERAYVVKTNYTLKNSDGEVVQELAAGTPIYKSKYDSYKIGETTLDLWTGKLATVAEPAMVCTSLLDFSTTDYVWAGKILSQADIAELKTKIIEKNKYTDDPNDATNTKEKQAEKYLSSYLDEAYYCTSAGKYGGTYFVPGRAYRALDTWCSMPKKERDNFTFNYDALDLLIDPTFSEAYGHKERYDGTNTNKVYSSTQPIDYEVEFVGYVDDQSHNVTEIKYTPKSGAEVTIDTNTAWLSREDYEAIPNEKRHYSPLIVTSPDSTYYMVRGPFMNGEVPYTVGQQIYDETYQSLGVYKDSVDVFKFTSTQTNEPREVEGKTVYDPKTYYYCRSSYTIDEKGEGKAVTTIAIKKNGDDVSSDTYKKADAEVEGSVDATVPQGVVIDDTTYNGLCNFQKGFVIHGTSPTEVSTLYISNESDINDLSTEKIITVVYLYEYDESDETGLNVTPVSERHILNIHINFKSGVPVIGDINKPDIVLPGTTLGMTIPSVTQGAFRVTESGWEIFSNGDDAATHYNGTPFYNNETPLYFYQDNYWLAYYAQTNLGKTYSKSVKLNVANYHDLKKVMDDKTHHYYIDHKDVERKPKIYINDYSASGENGLDLFKNLIDLSYETRTYDANGDPVPVGSGTLAGHVPFESHTTKPLKGGQYLEFFLKSDLNYSNTEAADDWKSIAGKDENKCFSGNFHGEGHTISGLDNSLFYHLCGNVYNLGVTGSFTGAGVAETGDGYVENCWISTSSTAVKTSKPVFGNPTVSDSSRPYRIVNCYYQEDDEAANKYTNHSSTYGIPTRKDSKAFYNGEVAYDLNGFYLYKRYCDQMFSSGNNSYEVFHMVPDGTGQKQLTRQTKYYSGGTDLCSAGYVEGRYEDGDFRFAEGSIPGSEDKRHYTAKDANNVDVDMYAPIWPDDYLFFGQSLTFDYIGAHQSQPSAINKISGRLASETNSNRVYRAPAYYGSSKMGVAHFNPTVILAAYSKPPTETSTDVKEAYPGMTAIDFAGYGDYQYRLGRYNEYFYQPLLDDGGLYSIENKSETQNLLVYAPSSEANPETYGVLNDYFTPKEPAFAFDTQKLYDSDIETRENYKRVAVAETGKIVGHLVQATLTNGRPTATTDHLLVDLQDFNCPIAYTMGDGKRMWYQRTPVDHYVTRTNDGKTKGWDGICLPFSPAVVSTQEKGEITHFYKGTNSDNSTNDSGHEYWLREFTGIEDVTGSPSELPAIFTLPEASGSNYTCTNTFLWDYYYKKNSSADANADTYQQNYYKASREYTAYPHQKAGKPYLVGFPGKSYYEFDLSGSFEAATAATTIPAQLNKQTISFVSATGATIGVSDDELKTDKIIKGNDAYLYCPTYVTKELPKDSFLLSNDGSKYEKLTAAAKTLPFRPYFVKKPKGSLTRGDGGTPNADPVRSIIFNDDLAQLKTPNVNNQLGVDDNLIVTAGKKKICVESQLHYTTDVTIVTPAGVTLASYSIQSSEYVETKVTSSGVYIVYADGGKYVKKVIVK